MDREEHILTAEGGTRGACGQDNTDPQLREER
jgi:hypothetical protein